MIKSRLIKNISAKMTHLPERVILNSVNQLLQLISDSLTQGQRVEVRGFGSFTLHHRPPRNAHNPKTGERVKTTAKYSPHFKPGKELRERIDASKSKYPIKEHDEVEE